jgi:hypothetical protein
LKPNNPIIRWTLGPVTKQGRNCLKYSIESFVDCYGENFDFYVCYNKVEKPKIDLKININYFEQKRPIIQGPTTIWKFTPPRIDKTKKELYIDNDIVFIKKNKNICNFFNNDKFLIARDNVKYYGRYDFFFDDDEKFNAGMIGLPSNFDLEGEILRVWKLHGSLPEIESSEEQALIAYILREQNNFILLNNIDFVILNGYGDTSNIFGNDWLAHHTYHFVELNRKYHNYYQKRIIKLL